MTGPRSTSSRSGEPTRIALAVATSRSTTSSCTLSWTKRREPAVQTWPERQKMPHAAALEAAARSASAKTMFGDLPPSSSETRLRERDASSMTRLPLAVEPVKETMSTRSSVTSGSPISATSPITTFMTPGGRPASVRSRARPIVVAGVWESGLTTTLHPAASAGQIFQAAWFSGKFHGAISVATPTGSLTVKARRPGPKVVVSPWISRARPA